MAAIKALQQWCRQQCEGYRDVNITNMTTSFRDGLAFCAILHRHKPDLINFNSLHKENVYENNHLAFRVAEEQLGIPALLDAEDMVNLRVPDRLSILTYVSQYYNYFHGRSPIGGMAAIKRPPSESSDEPVGKKAISETSPKSSRVHHPPTMKTSPVSAKRNMVTERSPVTTKKVLTENSNTTGMISSSCAICKKHVHLVQRHLVDGKLYHRNCFRCSDCTSTLLSGTYTSGPKPGTFICTSHQYKTSIPGSGAIGTGSNKTGVNQSNATFSTSNSGHLNGTGSGKTGTVNLGFHVKNLESKKPLEEPVKSSQQNKSTSSASSFNSISSSSSPSTSRWSPVGQKVIQSDDNTVPKPWTSSAAKTQAAREKFFQSTSSPAAPSDNVSVLSGREQSKTTQSAMPNKAIAGTNHYGVAAGTSEKDKARNFLLSALPLPSSSSASPSGSTSTSVQVTSRFSPSASHSQTTSPKMDSVKPEQTAKHAAAAGKPDRYSAVVEQRADAQPAKGSKSPDKSESPADWRSRLKPVEKGPGANSRVPDLKEKWSPTSQTSAAVPRTLTTGSTVTVNINPSISGKENKPTPSSISSASVGTGLKENKPAQSSTSTANQKNAWKENKPAQSSTSTANQNSAWKENKPAQSSTSIANQNSTWKENKPAQSSMSAANQNSAWKENKPAQSSTSTANQKNAWKENKPAQSSMSAANQNSAWKENKPSQSSTSAANHSSAPSKRTGWKEDKPTQSGTSSTSYIAAWKESKVSNSSISAGSYNTPSKETKPAEPSMSPADKTTLETAPSAELPKKKKLLVVNLDITKDWPEFQQNWQDTNVSRQREEPARSKWPVVQPVAPQRPQKPPRAVIESPIKPHPDYIPEEKIQQQLRDIEKQLDELELKGIDLEKELRSCEGDEREDALMVDWFKLIHEKQLLLRLESELMYKSKQQALEDQQINVEKELRNLLSMPDDLKSPRQKARESELLQKYVNIVNDRSDIVDCLDEDRLREKEEDQMMEAMIQGLDLQRDSPESPKSPKKKSKFRLSNMWKQKNVKTKAAE